VFAEAQKGYHFTCKRLYSGVEVEESLEDSKGEENLRRSSVSHQIGQRTDLDRWFMHPRGAQEEPTEGGARQPSDLIQKSRQPLDQENMHRG
jgi:hypothetical protein